MSSKIVKNDEKRNQECDKCFHEIVCGKRLMGLQFDQSMESPCKHYYPDPSNNRFVIHKPKDEKISIVVMMWGYKGKTARIMNFVTRPPEGDLPEQMQSISDQFKPFYFSQTSPVLHQLYPHNSVRENEECVVRIQHVPINHPPTRHSANRS